MYAYDLHGVRFSDTKPERLPFIEASDDDVPLSPGPEFILGISFEDNKLYWKKGVSPPGAPEPPDTMTTEEATMDMMADIDYRLGLIELGVQTKEVTI